MYVARMPASTSVPIATTAVSKSLAPRPMTRISPLPHQRVAFARVPEPLPMLAQNQRDRRRQRTHPAQEHQPDQNEMAGVSSWPLCNSSRMTCDRRN